MIDNAQARYSTGAIVLHWLIAIAVIVNWRIAEAAEHAASKEAEAAIMMNHKALGITILVLTLARLAWRLTHKAPPMPSSIPAWQQTLARVVHVIFYVMLIGLPIGGWLGVSYFGSAVEWFGMFTVPVLPVGQDFETGKAILELHHEGGEILLILIALHVLGALKHSFIDKVPSLSRMWFGRSA